MKKYFLITIVTFTAAFTLNAQAKFGYLNSQDLLSALPEIQAADTEITTFQQQLTKQGQEMIAEFETDYKAYMEEMQGGLLSKVESTKKEETLTAQQQKIQAYEIEVQQKLTTRREAVYKPILDKLTNVIKDYGKANGYTMIFDLSVGNILHAAESDDLAVQIKAAFDAAEDVPAEPKP